MNKPILAIALLRKSVFLGIPLLLLTGLFNGVGFFILFLWFGLFTQKAMNGIIMCRKCKIAIPLSKSILNTGLVTFQTGHKSCGHCLVSESVINNDNLQADIEVNIVAVRNLNHDLVYFIVGCIFVMIISAIFPILRLR